MYKQTINKRAHINFYSKRPHAITPSRHHNIKYNVNIDSTIDVITGFVSRVTCYVPLVEQELPTLPEHLSLPTFLIGFMLLNLQ